jgi:hypothetical protein
MTIDVQVPRWLLDGTSVDNEFFVIHAQSPRLIARVQYDEGCEEVSPPFVRIDGGWLAVPVEWIDRYDRTTWNSQEMEDSLNAALKSGSNLHNPQEEEGTGLKRSRPATGR